MIFAQPYKVTIEKEGVSHEIPVHNANGIYKSVELDEILESGKATIKAYQEYSKQRDSFYSTIKDKTIEDITEQESKLLDDYTTKEQAFQKQMRIDTLKFIEASIKEASKYRDIIDSLVGEETQEFIACVKTAGFGGSYNNSDEDKKKVNLATSAPKKNSKGGAKQRKK